MVQIYIRRPLHKNCNSRPCPVEPKHLTSGDTTIMKRPVRRSPSRVREGYNNYETEGKQDLRMHNQTPRYVIDKHLLRKRMTFSLRWTVSTTTPSRKLHHVKTTLQRPLCSYGITTTEQYQRRKLENHNFFFWTFRHWTVVKCWDIKISTERLFFRSWCVGIPVC